MRQFICGIDGYIGWSLALHLAQEGHEVYGVDNLSRRKNVQEIGSWSATPILSMPERIRRARELFDIDIQYSECDLLDYERLKQAVDYFKPDVVFHLGEQPSAPYSMMSREKAVYTQENNVIGNLNLLYAMKECAPDAALVKLGSMGEYGTPDVDIPEGFFEVDYRGRKERLPFPKQPGSFYHLSKVHDSNNIMLACKLWGLRATDIMQGVVYGTRTHEINPTEEESLCTRFDFDEIFATAINRFCAEAVIGHPITPYGSGMQSRGFLALIDSVQCLTLIAENPPQRGEYRVFNQLDEVYNIAQLAHIVMYEASKLGLKVNIENIENPRVEKAEHHYKVDHEGLRKLGFVPTRPIQNEVNVMLKDLLKFKERILEKNDRIDPTVTWTHGIEKTPREQLSYLQWCEGK